MLEVLLVRLRFSFQTLLTYELLKHTLNMPLKKTKSDKPVSSYTLNLSVQYATATQNLPSKYLLRRWTRAAMEQNIVLTIRIVGEEEARVLNRDYRGKDYATNVLTFEYGAPFNEQPLMGDIVLCAPVVEKEAQAQNKTLKAHYAHLTVHGVLHMQGYDHIKINDAKKMEALEIAILASLKIDNPYKEQDL